MHPEFTQLMGVLSVAILWGLIHGFTPHGHSWLVMLPFALGGMNARGMWRMALIFSLGMILTAAAAGALFGLVFYQLYTHIPEMVHHGIELLLGGGFVVVGLAFMVKPLSVHHAIDHICHEECHSTEEKALLHSGTSRAMFVLGAMSILIPCPTNLPIYMAIPALSPSPLTGALVFATYAFFTGVAVVTVAMAMVSARGFIAVLERRGYRQIILRVSGIIVLGFGLWLLRLGMSEHHHEGLPTLPGVTQPHVDHGH